MTKTIIIGAGLTGLTTGWKLSEKEQDVELLEILDTVGGTSSSFKHEEFILDTAPHKIYTQLPHILGEIKGLLKEDLLEIPKVSSIRLMGKYFDYPVGIKDLLLKMNPIFSLKCMGSYGVALMSNMIRKKEDTSYESYITNRFGTTIYSFVFKPLAEKIWGNPKELDIELAKTRVPMPSLLEILKSLITGKKHKPSMSAEKFYYPKKGIAQLPKKIGERIKENKGVINLNSKPTRINIEDYEVKSVEFEQNGEKKTMDCSFLMSTISPKDLISIINPKPPEEVFQAVNSLKYRSLIVFYLIVNKKRALKENWIFFPEKEIIFNRLSEQKNSSKFIFPENKTVLMAEVTCDFGDEIWNLPKEELYKRVIKDLEEVGILKKEEVGGYLTFEMKNVYPSYITGYKQNLNIVLNYLSKFKNMISNGRPGLFNYNNMDHCMDMGIIATEHILNKRTGKDWLRTCKHFETYTIVD